MSENHLSHIVATISFCVAIILLTLILSYSYLLVKVVAEKQLLTDELVSIRVQLDEEKEKRYLTEQDKNHLSKQVQILRTQLQKAEEQEEIKTYVEYDSIEEEFDETQVCRVDYREVNLDFLRQASKKTLSPNANERFEGFSILMDNIDYMNENDQRELIEFYLKKMDKRNREGVYYAAFIMSEFRSNVLKEYESQIENAYRPISYQPGWEKISYKFCKIENKLNNYF